MALPSLPFTANPGFILTTPYEQKDKPFKSERERPGEAILSKVLIVGDAVIDDQGTVRQAPCKVGDIIIHAYNNKDFEINFTKYRYVHITEVYGNYNESK